MTPSQIVAGMQEVQARLHELLVAARSLPGVPPREAGRKYSEADKARWREIARQPELITLRSNRARGRVIAKREGLPPGAAETIRRSI